MKKFAKIFRCHASLERSKELNNVFCISLWYNDTFDWALSFCVSFKAKENETAKEFIKRLKQKIADTNFEIITAEFDTIPYPPKNYTEKDLYTYFRGNCKVYNKMVDHVNTHFLEDILPDDWEKIIFKENE